ncbi:Eco57I restriction endonuclease [Roseibium sp. TrichSKD4]|uniref:Eco57I restriction-modification methylase domain-containing protein n=1 Tax=Roseibium sp. TrichSKD4 TaxID=744980 RepID=UPI0001E576E5|nr:DNA methyltransferase [Roseibium sp. TrichSKD4]EFO28822.1 Eco57I restriction endonuclease [Roseibium sp. TrichSKD4]
MKKSEAEKLVNDTFTQAYDEARFRRFIHELFHDYEKEEKKASSGTYIPEAFQDGIHSYKRLAKFTDPEGLEIDVLAVKVPRRNTLENARTMQRNFIARYLNGSRGGNMKDAALVAFYSDDCEDWRFSLVRMDYVLDEEKQKVRKELTPARRYSFLVGKHEKTHTARRQLLPVLQSNTETTLSELEAAFNIETVTKEFFEKYKALYLSLKEALEKHLEKDPITKTEFETKIIKTDDFAKRLLGQIVFLYFLQKKGWLGVAKGYEWGSGPKDFLQSLYRGEYGEYPNFFNDVLEPLFYEALATERHDNYYDHLKCRIPFLNGGLFEAIRNYDWVNTDILLDNAIFQEIFDIFDLYNFTVREDEPLDKEVAVDPEMLGKVFENLIPENERKGSGTYYTPREIVHYMCQESLINYLDAKLNIESRPVEEKGQQSLIPDFGKTDLLTNYVDVYAPVVPRDDLAEFIYHGDVAQEHDATAQVKTQQEDYAGRYQHKIPETVRKYASQIDDALAHVKICDPAIGSGAFPVGVMNEIVRARGSLNAYLGDEDRTPYDFKRHAIQESIYGVDIEASAVDIAKLRLWLSLVVDEEDFGTIKPLPNLEYKIVAGNSLLSVEKDLFNNSLFSELEGLKEKYFDETRPSEKLRLKNKIDELSLQVRRGQKAFDVALDFSEVFRKNKGFDLVIANPPYLKERDNKHVFEEVNSSPFGKKYHQGKMDYWFYFLHLGIDVVRRNGSICFITSRYWLNSFGAKKLIGRVKDNLVFKDVVDIGKLKVFDNVAGHHMVHLYSKSDLWNEFRYKILENDVRDVNETESGNNVTISTLRTSDVFRDEEINFRTPEIDFSKSEPLSSKFLVSQGVVQNPDKVTKKSAEKYNLTAGEGVFVLTDKELEDLNLNESELEYVKPFFEGANIKNYGLDRKSKKNLLYITKENCASLEGLLHIKSHLEKYKAIMLSRRETKDGRLDWWHLHWPRKEEYFTEEKIVVPSMFKEPDCFLYETQESFFGISENVILKKGDGSNLLALYGCLISNVAMYWFKHNGKERGAGYDISVSKLKVFPLPSDLSGEDGLEIAKFVEEKLLKQSSDFSNTKQTLKAINKKVYQLYGLTPEEIAIVEEAVQ